MGATFTLHEHKSRGTEKKRRRAIASNVQEWRAAGTGDAQCLPR